MSVDFYDMEQHTINLITFCTTHLAQILNSYYDLASDPKLEEARKFVQSVIAYMPLNTNLKKS